MTDVAAAYGMAGRPLWFVFAALFVIVMGRSHLFYWLGRGAGAGTQRLADQVAPTTPRTTTAPGPDPVPTAAEAPGPDPAPTVVAGAAAPVEAAPGTAPEAPDPATRPPAGRASALRTRAQRLLQTPGARRGLALVHRWGPLAVTFAYVTVGVQTAVFVGSGLVRMPYLRFTVASVPGSIAWALIWGTVGLSVVWAAVGLAATSPWALAALLVALAVAAGAGVLRHRSRDRTPAPSTAGSGTPAA